MSPASRMFYQFDSLPPEEEDFRSRKKSVRIHRGLENLVRIWKNGMEIFPHGSNAIEYGSFVEGVRQKYMKNTANILQDFSKLNCKGKNSHLRF